MDLNGLAINVDRLENGDWVPNIPDLGDIKFKVRGVGNKAFRKLQADLIAALPIAKKVGGNIDPAAQDEITSTCIVETILLDWSGLSKDGAPLPYSKEMAAQLLGNPQFKRFRDGVLWAASVVAENRDFSTGETAKN